MDNLKIDCVDFGKNPECEKTFIFTVAEQKDFAAKNLITPKRCKPCRKIKREKMAKLESEGKFKRG